MSDYGTRVAASAGIRDLGGNMQRRRFFSLVLILLLVTKPLSSAAGEADQTLDRAMVCTKITAHSIEILGETRIGNGVLESSESLRERIAVAKVYFSVQLSLDACGYSYGENEKMANCLKELEKQAKERMVRPRYFCTFATSDLLLKECLQKVEEGTSKVRTYSNPRDIMEHARKLLLEEPSCGGTEQPAKKRAKFAPLVS